MRRFRFTATAAMFLMVTALLRADTVVVSPITPSGWKFITAGDADLAFVDGPGTAPLGSGSAAITFGCAPVPWANAGALHTTSFDGTPLTAITELSYWEYHGGADGYTYAPPYVHLTLDLNGDGEFDWDHDDQIVFEPFYQLGTWGMAKELNGVTLSAANTVNYNQNGITALGVPTNTWHQWDILIGSWWCEGGALYPDVGYLGSPLVTIGGIVEAYPNAKIISYPSYGGVRITNGFTSHCDYVGYVDGFVLNTDAAETTVDFEPRTAYGVKEEAKYALAALLPTGDKNTDTRIGKAVDRLEDSLDEDYWYDDNTIVDKRVFDEEEEAVRELGKIDDPSSEVMAAIDKILAVDAYLAQEALDYAIDMGGSAKFIGDAEDAMADAAAAIDDGNYPKAVEHYRKAWENAQKAN